MAIQLTMAEIGLERLVLPNTRRPSGCGTIYTLFSACVVVMVSLALNIVGFE